MLALMELVGIILILSLGFSVIFKNRIEKMIPVSVMSIVSLMYISGYMRNLKIGFYSVLFLTVLSMIYIVYYVIKNKKGIFKYVSPYVIYYIIFAIWLYVRFSGRFLCEWDEFSHWGFTTKVMYDSNMFSNELGSTIYFVDYLPGTAVFQYFALQFSDVFREDLMSMAQGLFVFSFLMPILGELKVGIKQFFISAFMLFSAFIIPLGFYGNVYSSLYVDAVLGIIVGYILYQYFKEEEYNLFFYFKISLACGTLCIVKPSGIGLMAVVAIIAFSDFIAKGRYKSFIKDKTYKNLLLDLIPFIVGFIYKKAWSIRLDNLGYEMHFDTNKITLNGIIDVFSGKGQEYQNTTIDNFKAAFFGSNYVNYNFSSIAFLILLFIAVVALICSIKKDGTKRYVVLGITTSLSYLLYSFYMLLLYLFTYSKWEATSLASFIRYEYTIILGIALGLLLWLINILTSDTEGRIGPIAAFMCIVVFVLPEDITLQLLNPQEIEYTAKARQTYHFEERVRDSLTEDDKVYIISQGSDGYDYFVIRYLVSPVHTQTRAGDQGWWEISWNLGKDNGEGLSRYEVSANKWFKYLVEEEFNYVLLHKVDDQFREEYGELFDQVPQSGQLYKINYDNNILNFYEIP